MRLSNNDQSIRPLEFKWRKPPTGRLKCNIDASFADNMVGVGSCIRDDEGQFIAARTELFFHITNVDVWGSSRPDNIH